MRAYSFITTGDKASQGECDGEPKIPRKLKRQKEMAKFDSYLGSELIDPELGAKDNEELWKHFFKNKPACNATLAKTPSALKDSQKEEKPDLPPEEEPESSSEEEEEGERPDSE